MQSKIKQFLNFFYNIMCVLQHTWWLSSAVYERTNQAVCSRKKESQLEAVSACVNPARVAGNDKWLHYVVFLSIHCMLLLRWWQFLTCKLVKDWREPCDLVKRQLTALTAHACPTIMFYIPLVNYDKLTIPLLSLSKWDLSKQRVRVWLCQTIKQ